MLRSGQHEKREKRRGNAPLEGAGRGGRAGGEAAEPGAAPRGGGRGGSGRAARRRHQVAVRRGLAQVGRRAEAASRRCRLVLQRRGRDPRRRRRGSGRLGRCHQAHCCWDCRTEGSHSGGGSSRGHPRGCEPRLAQRRCSARPGRRRRRAAARHRGLTALQDGRHGWCAPQQAERPCAGGQSGPGLRHRGEGRQRQRPQRGRTQHGGRRGSRC